MANELIGQETLSPVYAPHSQGYMATHIAPTSGNTSWSHTSYMNRSFISFSFGGRWIDDWGLVATIDEDRMQRAGSANFEDLVSTYEVADGQFYWGTHYNANELSFILATDRITQKELDDFRHWFRAGHMAELILSEHPNRGIIARIGEPLNINVLPFEEKTTINILGQEYETSTTIYKGEINIRFVMDEPFWYSKEQYLDSNFIDANNNSVPTLENKDAIKIILEDGIPTKEMFNSTFIIGDNKIYSSDEIRDNEGLELSDTQIQYLYYPGNAPVEPEISFTLTPILNDDSYISSPKNSFTNVGEDEFPYDKMVFESVNNYELLYSLPSPYVGYNQAIKIFNTVRTDISCVELRRLLRDNVTDKHARAWAMLVADSIGANDPSMLVTENDLKTAIERMKFFLYKENSTDINSINIVLNSKTGLATCSGGYRYFTADDITEGDDEDVNRSLVYADNSNPEEKYTVGRDTDTPSDTPLRTLSHSNKIIPRNNRDFNFFGNPNANKVEDAGDMFRSAYLKLKDKNELNSNGEIQAWDESHPNSSYKIWTDTKNGLKNFKVNYKYMYY